MVATRRLDTQLKRERVTAAVDARATTGQELSIAAIARHAGVSRKFIYTHPDLRDQIGDIRAARAARRHARGARRRPRDQPRTARRAQPDRALTGREYGV
jgi:hypothetical protein